MTDPATLPIFLNPLTDFGFKHLFGAETNKDLLISFLNAIFKGEKTIIDIQYSTTEYAGNLKILKKVFFDVTCTAADGEQFIIDNAAEKTSAFQRAVYFLLVEIDQRTDFSFKHLAGTA